MAPTYRLYRAARIGIGTRQDPFRSALTRYIDGANGVFEQFDFDNKTSMYCLAVCESAVHAQCAADADILALSPEQTDEPALQAWLDGALGTLSQTVRGAIEADLIPIDDVTDTNNRRELMRRIALYFRIGQYMRGLNDSDAFDFMFRGLSLRVNQVPAATRNRIQAWMEERGLDTSWITSQTIVRAVVKYILVNVSLIPMRYVRALI